MTKLNFSVRGKLIEGKVIRMKSKKTAHIEIQRIKYIPKYERYLIKKNSYAVHIPDDIDISIGDKVLCGETRKISKTKSFVVIKKIDNNKTINGDGNETN
jgi:small subunit ribosomal protein S17